VDYFYTCIDDRPGEGYRLLARLKRREVNFLAFSAFPSGPGQVQLNFFPENHQELLRAANELNVQMMGPKKAFLIQGDDKVGALADIFRLFYDIEINIHAASCVCDDRGGYGLVLWVAPKDYEAAAKALGVNYEPNTAETV
jgi:hypothetical protein